MAPSPFGRPLPPVSTPLKAPPCRKSTMERKVTGKVVVSPEDELNTTEPELSPGVSGARSWMWIDLDWPGFSVTVDGETEPNEVYFSVATRHGMVPLVPLSALVMPKITPV